MRAVGWGAVGAMLGLVVALLAWHLWTDHVAFHVIVDFLNQHGGALKALAEAPK